MYPLILKLTVHIPHGAAWSELEYSNGLLTVRLWIVVLAVGSDWLPRGHWRIETN